MELGTLAPWGSTLVALVALGVAIAGNRSKAMSEKMRWLADRVDKVEDRATAIETRLEHLPAKETTHRLEVSMTELRAEVAVLAERIKPVAAVSERLQEFLLDEVKRR
ncbi:MAG: DUF2730 family protein [Rhizobiales bacterium]|nr:DUF2730 family protein [Hyphomicrobiales bacterium]